MGVDQALGEEALGKEEIAEEVWKRVFPAKVGDLIRTKIQTPRGKHIEVDAYIVGEKDDSYFLLFLKPIKVRSKWGYYTYEKRDGVIKKDVRRYRILRRKEDEGRKED